MIAFSLDLNDPSDGEFITFLDNPLQWLIITLIIEQLSLISIFSISDFNFLPLDLLPWSSVDSNHVIDSPDIG